MIQGATGPVGGQRDAVNYYPHHIGDYLRDTSHLTALEDGTYRRMLDLYYASEKPLPMDFDWLTRLVRAREEPEREAVKFILDKFFVKHEDGWHNKRADEEIRKGRVRAKVARTNGKRGGRPITRRVISGLAKPNPTDNPVESSQNQNQKPITKVTTNTESSRKNGARHALPDVSPILATLPLRDGSEFPVRQSLVAELEPLYPAVDLPATLKEMKGWLLLNADRRKTRAGIRRFIGNWLQSEQAKHGS
jgi:uncharacterized protein YdaU (DUF1376 family)